MRSAGLSYTVLTAVLLTALVPVRAAAQDPSPGGHAQGQPQGHAQSHAQASEPAEAKPAHVHYTNTDRANQPSPTGALAPRLLNLGTHRFEVTTQNRDAQAFISQGVNLSYGFNHAESGRAFREAARLDPSCAMAYWGQALVLGPNINAAMDPAAEAPARELSQKALSMVSGVTPRERALIEALAERYSGRAEDRAARDRAYADAMRRVHEQFPDDPDIAMFYVESVMDLRPWGYWMPDGRAHAGTLDIVQLTEQVMARHPQHPGALHLYIHLMEPTDEADKAETAADRLLTLMPAAGHMVHMPSHIYQRVGRYADAIRSNELAVAADEDYITQCRAQGLYPMGYYPHNIHFLWFAATADGQGARAIEAARKVASRIDDAALAEFPMLAGFRVVPYFALTRFGRWAEMLAEPAPPESSPFLRGAWHYGRGLALVATGKVAEADRELAALDGLMRDGRLDQPLFSPNSARDVLAPAPLVLGAELAAARGDFDRAIALLERAVRLEDWLVYTEPSEWHYPPRQALGAVLLEAGRPREAETVYWQDLKRNPENGWSLFGLVQALRAQGRTGDADIVEARFQRAWARSDVTLTASRFGRPAAQATAAAR
jgi:tetratricopeptide (TPR) repeat protein